MKKRIWVSLCLCIAVVNSICSAAESSTRLTTPSGFTTEAALDMPAGTSRPVGIVLLHGKRGSPQTPQLIQLREELVNRGYKVIAPVMPWSQMQYQGTRLQGQELITQAAKTIKTDRVVVIGHSMGAMAVLQYGSGKLPPQVAGIVVVAPGHDPNMARGLENFTSSSVSEACQMESDGAGKKFGSFKDMDGPARRTIHATAEYYCSFFSTDRYPDTRDIVGKIQAPILFISGEQDKLTEIYEHESLFSKIPENPRNKYEVLEGTHMDVLSAHPDVISQWIDNL